MASEPTKAIRSRRNRPGPAHPTRPGVVEAAARLPAGDGWILLGWTARAWAEIEPADRLHAVLSFGIATGTARTAFYRRQDVPEGATGFCTILSGQSPPSAKLLAIELPQWGLRLDLLAGERAPTAAELGVVCRRAIRGGFGLQGHPLLELLPRPVYEGKDSVAELWPPVHLELDQALRVPADGLALAGWLLDPGASVIALRARGAEACALLGPNTRLTIRRPDIVQQFGARYGLEDDRFGFVAYAPGVARPGSETYLELETAQGEIAYKPVRVLERPALGAIKQILSVPRPLRNHLRAAFDEVLGPIVHGLNSRRLGAAPKPSELSFGDQHGRPEVSLVIPLHARLDFMEHQLALFSERPEASVEILYIMDDPPLEGEAERLASSCWARFRLPFRLLCLSENLGYAPANNIGLRHATGEYACLLNSDVFPIGPNGLSWLLQLTSRLSSDPSLGAVGPLLLYGDGTVQHQGMHYEKLPELEDWFFPMHTNKGSAPPSPGGLIEMDAITGACMVVRRKEILALGGLDEDYLIGDFEDADLCQRYRQAGQRCVVDSTQHLYHLERQSQGEGQPWRANATLYNAWRFNRRWAEQLHG